MGPSVPKRDVEYGPVFRRWFLIVSQGAIVAAAPCPNAHKLPISF